LKEDLIRLNSNDKNDLNNENNGENEPTAKSENNDKYEIDGQRAHIFNLISELK
jgi:hypothetical protein